MTKNAAAAKLEARITEVVGEPVEITVRGARSFTFSTEEVCQSIGDKLTAFFGNAAKVSVEHDDECGSFAYVEV